MTSAVEAYVPKIPPENMTVLQAASIRFGSIAAQASGTSRHS
jgi:hypothetical protein